MHEGRNLLEQWAGALEMVPVDELASRFTEGEQVEELTGPSGSKYRLTVEALWESEDDGQSDFYLLLRLRPASAWRPFRVWRANLVSTYDRGEKRMNPMKWVQRPPQT